MTKVAAVETKTLGLGSAVAAAHDWAATPCFEVELEEGSAEITPYGVIVGITAAAAAAVVVKAVATKLLAF